MRKKLSTYIWEYKWHYLFAIIALIISVSLDMLSPMLTMHIIDDVIVGRELTLLPWLLGGILMVGVGRCVFQYCKEYTFDKAGSKIASDMRLELFDHIQSLSCNYFDKTNTGELMARVKDDIDRIWDTLSYVGMLIIEVIFHTTVVLFCMYNLNAPLAIIPTLAMILCGFIAIKMENRLGDVYEAISEENATLNTVAEENLAGVRTVKAFAREKFEIKKFLSHNKRYYDLNMQQSKIFVKYYPCFQIITKLLPMTILLLGGRLVMKDVITLGALGAFIEYSNNIVWPMEMLGWLSNSLSAGIASNKKINKIYEQKPAITESAKIDGANDFVIFMKLILPLSKPLIATLSLFSALAYWNDWYNCMLYITNEDMFTLQYYLQRILGSAEAMRIVAEKSGIALPSVPLESMKMAMTVIATGPIVLLYPFVQRYFVKGLTIGAVKG
mgnify:CR=1 FL=1